jgi:alkaline phosphatase D
MRGAALPAFLVQAFFLCVIATFPTAPFADAATNPRLDTQTTEDHIAVGDVTEHGAVLWVQAEFPGTVTAEIAEDEQFKHRTTVRTTKVSADSGLTGQIEVATLQPATRYYYCAWPLRKTEAKSSHSKATIGSFTTAPASGQAGGLTLLIGGDLGGQGYGRIRTGTPLPYDGYHIFRTLREEHADLFLAMGDMVYTDGGISATAPDAEYPKDNDYQIPKPGPGYVSNLSDYRRDWDYNRQDHHFRRFLATTPILAQLDDHEIVNDGGGRELLEGPTPEELAFDPRLRNGDPVKGPVFYSPQLFRDARRAFLEFNPIRAIPDPVYAGERRIYRNLRWGRHAEIFILDTRSYRDPKYREDKAQAPKSMLGPAQKQWLKEALSHSGATWKLISSSIPLSIGSGDTTDPNGHKYRDGWGKVEDDNPYGYERELLEIIDFIRGNQIKNVVFLSADRHWSTLLSYDLDQDGRPDFYEVNVGALRAGRGTGGPIDPTLHPTVLFTDAKASTFAYGYLNIDKASGRLTVEIRQIDGTPAKDGRVVLDPK